MKKDKKKNLDRKKYELCKVDEGGNSVPLTEEEIKKFEEEHPEIAAYWIQEKWEELANLDDPRPWEAPTKKLLNILWKSNHAWIFHEPVDYVKLNIPDYPAKVSKPMDFSTIKRKLYNNVYHSPEEFLDDLELVFDNCINYNGLSNEVGLMGQYVKQIYTNQLNQLGLQQYRIVQEQEDTSVGNV